jgi:hypothetical protein
MLFESLLEKITTPASPDTVLVCEASFNGLRGFVIDKKGDKLTVGQEASTTLFDLNEAVSEVVQQLRQLGWKGQHAIVVSPAVCLTVLDLNVPAKNKLQVQQIAETIQWEFEPAFNQYKSVLTIGQILQVLGLLNASQVDEVLQQQNAIIDSKNNAVEYKRFGELALAAGFIKKKQLDDALNRQRWFVSEGDAIKCGWHPLPWQPFAEMGDFKWLVAGIKQDLLREWQAAFTTCEVKLEAIYPVAGGVASVTGDDDNDIHQGLAASQQVLLGLHKGLMSAVAVSNDSPMQIQAMSCTADTLLGSINELLTGIGDVDDVPICLVDCLSESEQASEQLTTDIQNILMRPVRRMATIPGKISLPMRNATRYFMRVKEVGHVEGVTVHEPLPPLLQRFSTRAILAALLVIGVIALAELGLVSSELFVSHQIAAISEDVGKIRSEVKRINTKISTIKTLQQDIDKKEADKKNATTMITLLTKELPERNQTLTLLMDKLQASVTEEVVINGIKENTLLGFDIKAWTLSDQSAQSFIKNFQLAIHSMNFSVKNLTVSEETGRLGLLGYGVSFSITQHSDTEWNRRRALPKPKY